MKRTALLAIALLLGACQSQPHYTLQAPKEAFPTPPPPERVKGQTFHPTAGARAPRNVSSAGPLKLAMVGDYMDAQEKDLRTILRGASIRRIGDDLILSVPDKGLFSGEGLSARGSAEMAQVADLLRHYDQSAIQIAGYMDTAKPESDALEISSERARAVADVLVADGVGARRVTYQGYGSQHLRIATGPGQAEPRNRRIEMRIVARPQT